MLKVHVLSKRLFIIILLLQLLIMCSFLCLIYFTVFCVSEVLKIYITEILVKPREDGECDISQLSLVSEPNSERLASSFD